MTNARTSDRWRSSFTGVWPLAASLILFLSAVAWIAVSDCRANGGLIYAQDDPYIGMAMAKNIVLHGVYGVSRYRVSPASSSILWPWLLALWYAVAGVRDYPPLVINIIAGMGILCLFDTVLRRGGLTAQHPLLRFLVLAAVVCATPLPVMVIIAMEHLLHGLLLTAFAVCAAGIIAREPEAPLPRRRMAIAAVLACLAASVRYETLVCVAFAVLLLAVRRRFGAAFAVLAAGLAPAIIYGTISLAHGFFFLPNSVISKALIMNSRAQGVHSTLTNLWTNGQAVIALTAVAILQLVFIVRGRRLWRFESVLLLLFLGSAACHLASSANYFFYRYQSYLVVFGMLATAAAWNEGWKLAPARLSLGRESKATPPQPTGTAGAPTAPSGEREVAHTPSGKESKATPPQPFPWKGEGESESWVPAARLAAWCICMILVGRPLAACRIGITATENIRGQQYRAGLFLRKYYQGQAVMVNDIGAMDYLADIDVFDDLGLATTEVTRFQVSRQPYGEQFLNLVHERNVKIAIVYSSWVPYQESDWVPIVQYGIPDNVACTQGVVTIIAVDPSIATTVFHQCEDYFAGPGTGQ